MRQKLAEFVEKRLPEFHRSRIDSLEGLRLGEVLKRKNPYLFRAKNSGSADEFDPLGKQAKERNEEFRHEYAKVRNRFTCQFIDEYCTAEGEIDWHKIVRINSAKRESKK